MNIVCQVFGHKLAVTKDDEFYAKCTRTGCEESHRFYRDDSIQEIQKTYRMENTFWDSKAWVITKVILAAILGLSLMFVLVSIPFLIINNASCNVYKEMGVDAVWNFWTGCMAKHPEFGWLPVGEYFNSMNVNIP